jgi:phage terminase Nu1 subunit (DNA packaging protein)
MASKNGARLLREEVTRSDLAALVALSERQVQRLTNQGVFPLARNRQGRFARAKYILGQAVPRFVKHLRETLSRDANEEFYKEARARRMAAHAAAAELTLKLQRGKLHRSDDIEFVMVRMITVIKQHLLSIPGRVMHQLVGLTDPVRINQIVRDEVERSLTELSEFKMSDIISRAAVAAHLGIDEKTLEEFERRTDGAEED